MAIDRIEWIPLLFGLVVHNLIGGGFAPIFLLFLFSFSRLPLRSTACVIAATIPLLFLFILVKVSDFVFSADCWGNPVTFRLGRIVVAHAVIELSADSHHRSRRS
jgi:hypothetical protein